MWKWNANGVRWPFHRLRFNKNINAVPWRDANNYRKSLSSSNAIYHLCEIEKSQLKYDNKSINFGCTTNCRWCPVKDRGVPSQNANDTHTHETNLFIYDNGMRVRARSAHFLKKLQQNNYIILDFCIFFSLNNLRAHELAAHSTLFI